MHPLVQQTSLTQHAAWMEKSLHRLAGVGSYVLSRAVVHTTFLRLVDWLWCSAGEQAVQGRTRHGTRSVTSALCVW